MSRPRTTPLVLAMTSLGSIATADGGSPSTTLATPGRDQKGVVDHRCYTFHRATPGCLWFAAGHRGVGGSCLSLEGVLQLSRLVSPTVAFCWHAAIELEIEEGVGCL